MAVAGEPIYFGHGTAAWGLRASSSVAPPSDRIKRGDAKADQIVTGLYGDKKFPSNANHRQAVFLHLLPQKRLADRQPGAGLVYGQETGPRLIAGPRRVNSG
jgi:hypothetical protein